MEKGGIFYETSQNFVFLLVLCLTMGATFLTVTAADIVDSGTCGDNLT